EPLLDRLPGVRAPGLEPLPEDRLVRRRDEDQDCIVMQCVADLARALDLDLQDDGGALADALLDLTAERPGVAAAVAGVLQEIARLEPLSELLRGEEVVVATVHLAGPRLPRRGRDRQLELRDPLEQQLDQRALPDPRRTGDDEDLPHEDCIMTVGTAAKS